MLLETVTYHLNDGSTLTVDWSIVFWGFGIFIYSFIAVGLLLIEHFGLADTVIWPVLAIKAVLKALYRALFTGWKEF
jgi:hypothetical protein